MPLAYEVRMEFKESQRQAPDLETDPQAQAFHPVKLKWRLVRACLAMKVCALWRQPCMHDSVLILHTSVAARSVVLYKGTHRFQ